MSTESVSFKGYLRRGGDGGSDEVRRFMIDTAVSTNYVYLQEKLATVFPDLKRQLFAVTWTDEDGDDVTIASDEELLIALTEMKGPLYKINIHLKGEKKEEIGAGSSSQESAEEKEVHPGVTCDGCEGPVVGARYKCVVCPDYDLCSACEAKCVHPGHNMMKMTKPGAAWPGHFFRRLHKMQERAEQREKRREKSEDKDHQGERGNGNGGMFGGGSWGWGRGRCGGGRGGAGWGRGGCGPRGRGGMFRGGMFPPGHPFEEMMRGWMGPEAAAAGDAANSATFQEQMNKTAEAIHNAAHQAATAQAASDTAANDYLMNMGGFIAAAMDPFGINVDVSVETPDGVKTKVSSSSTTTSSTTTTKDGEEEMNVDEPAAAAPKENEAAAAAPTREREAAGDATLPKKMKLLNLGEEDAAAEFEAAAKEFDAAAKEADAAAKKAEAVLKEAAADAELNAATKKLDAAVKEAEAVIEPEKEKSGSPTPSSDDEDWTMLRKEEEKVVKVPINVQDGYRVLYADAQGNLYPKLPEQETAAAPTAPSTPAAPTTPTAPATPAAPATPSAPAPIPVAQHPDPKIQVALQAMLNMGFSNEGGWLTTLLEAKGGDIGKVLDLLRDVRK